MSKIYFRSLLLFLFVALSHSSCTIEKRLYRSGYHINAFKRHSTCSDPAYKKEKKLSFENTIEATPTPEINLLDTIIQKTDVPVSIQPPECLDKLPIEKEMSIQQSRTLPATCSPKKTQENMNQTSNITTQKNAKKQLSKRTIALIIGISLLLMATAAAFSAPVFNQIFVSGNASQTAVNLLANFGKFRGSIIGWIAIFLLDIIVSIGLFKYYKNDHARLATISATFRLIYTAILGLAISQLFLVKSTSAALTSYQFLRAFSDLWGVGLIVFGVHLIVLGILFKNKNGKKWVTILIKLLLIIAGIGYIVEYVGLFFVANPIAYSALIQSIFIVPMILGEISFAIWMIAKGGKRD